MNINILPYSLFGIAGGQEVDHTFVEFKTMCSNGIHQPRKGDV